MKCSPAEVKNQSLNKVRTLLKGKSGKAKSITVKDTYAQFSYGPEFRIKNMETAVSVAKDKQLIVEKWAEDTFGTAFSKGWTSLKTSPENVFIDFTFPAGLQKAYEKKTALEQKSISEKILEKYKQKTANEYIYAGEIYSSMEDMQDAINRDSDFLPDNEDFSNANFVDYINSKKALLSKIGDRLNNLKANRRYQKNKDLNQEIRKVNDIHEALEKEITDLENSPNLFAESMKVFENDFALVDSLLADENPSIDNIHAAEHILQYFKLITDYGNNKNEFIPDGKIENINPLLKAELDKTLLKTQEMSERIQYVKEKYLLDVIESSERIKAMFPGQEAKKIREHILKDVDDIDVLSQYFLTVDKQFVKTDSLLAQIIRQELEQSRAFNKAVAAGFIGRINNLTPKVTKKLVEMGHGISFTPLNKMFGNANFKIFYQKTATGTRSPNLINKFSKRWFESYSQFSKVNGAKYWSARKGQNWDDMDAALIEKYDWIDENAEFLDITRVPEIVDDTNMQNWSGLFDKQAAQAYKAEIIGKIGKYNYEKLVEEQKEKIEDYRASMQNEIDMSLNYHNVESFQELPTKIQHKINIDMARNSPFKLVDSKKREQGGRVDYSYGPNGGVQFQSHITYNTYFPKTQKQTVNSQTETVSTVDSGFYDAEFDQIASDPDLLAFWEVLNDATSYMNMTMNSGTNMVVQGSVPQHRKMVGEILLDKNMTAMAKSITLFESTKQWIKDLFSSSTRYADNVDEIINSGNIQSLQPTINKKTKIAGYKLQRLMNKQITGATRIDISSQPVEVQKFFQDLTGMTNSQMLSKFGSDFSAKKIIRDYIIDGIMAEQSFNLPVVMRAYLDMVSEYKSQKDAMPKISIFKDLYENIEIAEAEEESGRIDGAIDKVNKRIARKRKEKGIVNKRIRANTRLNHWFNKNVLNSDDPEQWINISSVTGKKNHNKLEREFKKEAEEQLKFIEEKLAAGTDIRTQTRLETEKEEIETTLANIGRDYTLSAAYNTVVNRLAIALGLGYNVNAAITNRYQGWYAGIINDTGKYWTQGNFLAANAFINRKGLRYIPGNGAYKNEVNKTKLLIDKLQIIQDATNEMDRARNESGFKGVTKKLNPFYLTEYVEWHNQTPQILSMLMDETITDKNGNVKRIFDGDSFPAYNIENGKLALKPEFRTQENIETWEDFGTPKYSSLKSKMSDTIAVLNGDYSKTGSTYAKKTVAGKTLMTFKTWLPNQLWQRFAYNQQSLALGKERYDGIYTGAFITSKTGTAASAAMATGFLAAGVMSMGLGLGLGLAGGVLIAQHYMAKQNTIDDSDIKVAAQLAGAGKAILSKLVGIPVNSIAGKEVVPHYNFDELEITDAEKQNLMTIMNEIAVLLGLTLAKVIHKALFADNEEEEPISLDGTVDNPYNTPEKTKSESEKAFYNLLENQLTKMITDSSISTNPSELFNTVSSTSIHQWLTKVEGISNAISMKRQGLDVITTGPNEGESRLSNQLQKSFLPKIFHGFEGLTSFGLKNSMDQEWNTNEDMDSWFYSDYKKDRKIIRAERKLFKAEQLEYWKDELGYEELTEEEKPIFKKIIEDRIDDEIKTQLPYPKRVDYDEEQNLIE